MAAGGRPWEDKESQKHTVGRDRTEDHSTPALLLLCMHTQAHTLVCTHTSKPPWGLIKAAEPSPSLAMSPLPQGPETDTGIIGLNTPTVLWEWLGLGKCCECVCLCVCCFDPVNAAQLAGEWLMSHWISGYWWWWWGEGAPQGRGDWCFSTPPSHPHPSASFRLQRLYHQHMSDTKDNETPNKGPCWLWKDSDYLKSLNDSCVHQ